MTLAVRGQMMMMNYDKRHKKRPHSLHHYMVHSLLHGAQLNTHNELRLGGHVLQHVRLEATQQVGT